MPRKNPDQSPKEPAGGRASSSVEELLLAALERGDDGLETGRYLVTFKESAVEQGLQSLGTQGLRVADAREFEGQAATLETVGDADAVVFPEIGVALVGSEAAVARGLGAQAEIAVDSPIESIEPEYFMFAEADPTEYQGGFTRGVHVDPVQYVRAFARAAATIASDLTELEPEELETEEEVLVLGATWGLVRCKVPPSVRSGVGIKVAVLDTGMDRGHPDFPGRPITGATFVGQPIQDLHGHGTHCIGTACGPKAPVGSIPRYGIAYKAPIFVGKVLTNSGTGTMAGVLAGMNWAIANRCPVISMSLGAPVGVQPAYTAAGASALSKGCLIIAAAGNGSGAPTGAPANSPTIMSVASLDPTLTPSAFSNRGKIEIAAPGRDVFSSWPRPRRYNTISGTSMATPHVAGCAALWAESSPALRATALWRKLQATARRLSFPPTRVGAGLVQAP
jgi:subtilisin family serine protease